MRDLRHHNGAGRGTRRGSVAKCCVAAPSRAASDTSHSGTDPVLYLYKATGSRVTTVNLARKSLSLLMSVAALAASRLCSNDWPGPASAVMAVTTLE